MDLDKTFNLLFRVLSIILLIGILANAFPTFFWQDDFSYYTRLKDQGLIEFAKQGYLTWDGRHFTIGGFVQTSLIKYTSAPFTISFWAFSLILTSFLTAKIIGTTDRNVLISTGIITASLIVLFKSHAGETIYWATGGVYVFNLFLGALWLWLYTFRDQNKSFLYLITLLIGATTQNLTIGLMLIVFADFIFTKLRSGKFDSSLILLFVLFLPGMIFISLAPGSIQRSQHYSEVNYAIPDLAYKIAVLYYRALSTSLITIPTALITSLFLCSKVPQSNRGYLGIRYFLAAILSLSIFIFLPIELSTSHRIFIYFHFFLFLALVNLFLWLFKHSEKKFSFFNKRHYGLLSILIFSGFLIFSNIVVWMNFEYGIQLFKKFKAREKIIVASPQNSDIVIPKIQIKWNSCTYLHSVYDLSDSADDFANKAAAEYYHKRSIVTKEELDE